MATVQELIKQCNTQFDETYDNATYYAWFNDCLMDLAPLLFKPKPITLTLTNGEALLPTDFKSALKVVVPAGELQKVPLGSTAYGYTLFADKILVTLPDTSSITLYYDALPNSIGPSTATQAPDLPVLYHRLLIEYAGMRAMIVEDEVGYENRHKVFKDAYFVGRAELKDFMSALKKEALSGSATQWAVTR